MDKIRRYIFSAITFAGLVAAAIFVVNILDRILGFVQNIFVAKPVGEEIVFHSTYLFLASPLLLLAAMYRWSIHIETKHRRTLLLTRKFWLEVQLGVCAIGAAACLFVGMNEYYKINQYHETMVISAGVLHPSYSTYLLDDIGVYKSKVRISSGKAGIRYADRYRFALPNGTEIETVANSTALANILQDRTYGVPIIADKPSTSQQNTIESVVGFLDWAAICIIPLIFFIYIEDSEHYKRKKANAV